MTDAPIVIHDRNDLWVRYEALGEIPHCSWRKSKIKQELEALNKYQSFVKRVVRSDYELNRVGPAFRDILVSNGLMTFNEWKNGKLLLTFKEWQEYILTHRIHVDTIADQRRKLVKS